MKKVLIADKLSDSALEELRSIKDFHVEVKTGLKENELVPIIQEFDAIVVRSATKVTKNVLNSAKNLKIAVRAGIGLDNIDVETAKNKGIAVANTPEATSISVAELTIGLMLALVRKICIADSTMKEHKWEKKILEGEELYGKTAGIIGFGRIGKEVAKREIAFGMKVLAHDIIKQETDLLVSQVSREELLKNSDFISVHLPLTESTKDILSYKEFEIMKNGVYLINVSRGGVVNEKALFDALNSGKVSGVALDVFSVEPPEDFSLIDHPNVIATPHIGASAKEGQERAGMEVIKILKEFFKV
ncbi:MAG: hydroxyacid dehydrogenase [Acidobacteriota bacterium]